LASRCTNTDLKITSPRNTLAYNVPDSKCNQEYPIVEIAESELERFRKLAPNKNDKFKLGEPKAKGRYIHILCNDYPIGCYDKYGELFVFHSNYPYGGTNKKVERDKLTDDEIRSAIVDTLRKRRLI